MLYKQGIMREDKIINTIGTVFSALMGVLWLSLPLLAGEKDYRVIVGWMVIWLPVCLFLILMPLNYYEWFCFYADRVEVRCVFGIKSVAYYKDVTFIEKKKLAGNYSRCWMAYLFHEDKKEIRWRFSDILDYEFSIWYNRRRRNVRVYYTEELERFIEMHLKDKLKPAPNER